MDFLLCSATVIYVNITEVLCIREKMPQKSQELFF